MYARVRVLLARVRRFSWLRGGTDVGCGKTSRSPPATREEGGPADQVVLSWDGPAPAVVAVGEPWPVVRYRYLRRELGTVPARGVGVRDAQDLGE